MKSDDMYCKQVNNVTANSYFLHILKKILHDKLGNFGILTAILLPVLVVAGGMAIDVTNMSLLHSELQEATDAATLAAAEALADGSATTVNAKDLANNFVLGQMSNYLSGDTGAANDLVARTSTTVKSSSNLSGGTSYSVSINTSYDMPTNSMTRLFGMQSIAISASSSTTSGTSVQKTALSMELVLDKSGSMRLDTNAIDNQMSRCLQYYDDGKYLQVYDKEETPCYLKKIAAQRAAANSLLDQLDSADPKSQYARTAAIAWSSQVDRFSDLDWGTKTTRTNVINKLFAEGGTDSSVPMQQASDTLNSQPEAAAQAKKGNKNFQKIIVLMTDGQNDDPGRTAKTRDICDQAKNAGVQIYSVAFMAPPPGQDLLRYCASAPSNYFDAEQMSDLLVAFKTIGAQATKQMALLTK